MILSIYGALAFGFGLGTGVMFGGLLLVIFTEHVPGVLKRPSKP